MDSRPNPAWLPPRRKGRFRLAAAVIRLPGSPHYPRAVAGTPQGGAVAVTFMRQFNPTVEYLAAIRADAQGDLVWQKRIDRDRVDEATPEVAADGSVFLAGSTSGSDFLLKLDASGDLLWERSFGVSGMEFGSLISTAVGGCIATGSLWWSTPR